MRYASYKQKYAKKIQKLNLLFKLRYVFIGVGAATVATTCTLLGVKGSIGKTTPSKDTYVYGEEVNVLSNAIMNDYSIEYAHKDKDDWSSDKPVKPGEYQARAVSKSGFGGTKLGKEVYFTIIPADLHLPILSTRIVYGDNPVLDLSEATRQNLRISDISYTFGSKFDESDPFDGKSTFKDDVTLNSRNLDIIDESGNNLNDCYKVISDTKQLDIEKRDIVVDFADDSKEYDATAVEASACSINPSYSLAFSDELKCENLTSLTDVGKAVATADVKIVRGETDKTAFYNITKNNGSLVVNKRKVTIKTFDINRSYNGRVLSYKSQNADDQLKFEINPSDGILDSAHHIKIDEDRAFALEGTYITKNGSKENKIDRNYFQIVDKDDNPVESKYYDLTFETGTVNITPIPIVLSFKSVEKFYDGDPATGGLDPVSQAELQSKIVAGDEYSVEEYKTADGGLVSNQSYGSGDSIVIHNTSLDKDVQNDCYDLQVAKGTMTIKRRNIVIRTNDVTKLEYDGNPLTTSETAPQKDQLKAWIDIDLSDPLIQGHTLEFDKDTFALKGKRVTTNNEVNSVEYDIKDALGDSFKDNPLFDLYYHIEPRFGVANVKKYKMEVTFDTNITYDERNKVMIECDHTPFPNEDDHFDQLSMNNEVNAGDAYFSPNVLILDGDGHDITTDYYDVQISNPTTYYGIPVNFSRRSLHINTSSHEAEYDGMEYNSSIYTPDSHRLKAWANPGELAPGHELRVDFIHENKYAPYSGKNTIDPYTYKVVDTNNFNADVTDRYEFEGFNYGDFVITKRNLDISFTNLVKICDGTANASPLVYNPNQLAQGDSIDLDLPLNDERVGSYSRSIVITGSHGDVTNCYDLDANELGFTSIINPREVTITTATFQKQYDNDPLEVEDLGIQVTNLLSNHKLVLDDYDGSIAGTKDVKFDGQGNVIPYSNYLNYVIKDKDTNVEINVEDYYNIHEDFGEITINKAPIQIRNIYGSSKSFAYDATEHGFNNADFEVVSGSLPNNFDIVRNQFIDPGTYSEDLFRIQDASHNDVTRFFDITLVDPQALIINKIDITYALREPGNMSDTLTKVYDAEAIDLEDYFTYYCSSPLPTSVYDIQIVPHNTESELRRANQNPIAFDYDVIIIDKLESKVLSDAEVNKYFTLTEAQDTHITKFKINQKELHFTEPDLVKTYDNIPLTRSLVVDDSTDLATGDEIVSSTFDMTTQTEVANNVKILNSQSIKIRNYNGEDVTDCYQIFNDFGTYTVNKRKVKFTFADITPREYSGYAITDSEILSKKSQVVSGEYLSLIGSDKLSVTAKEEYKYVTEGYVTYEVIPKIMRGSIDVTSNYEITIETGTYKIDRKYVEVESVGTTKIFDGDVFDFNYLVDEPVLADTDFAEVLFTGNIDGYNAGPTQYNTFDMRVYSKANPDLELTNQYDIHATFGTVTINQRVIEFKTYDRTYTYSGGYYQVKDYIDLETNNTYQYFGIQNSGDEYYNFKMKSDVDIYATFEQEDASSSSTHSGGKYEFFQAGTYNFECIVYVTVDGETYSSDECIYGISDENVVFKNTSSDGLDPGISTYKCNRRNLILTTASLDKLYFAGSPVKDCEKIYCSGLANGDTLYIYRDNEHCEKYNKDTTEYAFINLNGTILASQTDPYYFGANFGSNIHHLYIERIVGGQRVDVTDCYNITYSFTDSIKISIW